MEALEYFRFAAALLVVLGLIGLLAWLARRWRLTGPPAARGAARRLEVVEVAALDPRRRLVLVRRDEVEHLLLLAQDGGLVIEAGIRPGGGRRVPAGGEGAE
jgi:flagellar protein FliO/FliZ